MLNQSLITTNSDFLGLEQEWRALLPRTQADSIFLTWEWVSTWWEVFGEDKQLHILTFREDGRLVGLLPCYIRKRSMRGIGRIRELRLIGSGETVRSEYLDLLCLSSYREGCLEGLSKFLLGDRRWDIAVFSDLEDNSILGKFIPARIKGGKIIGQEPCYQVTIPSDFETYLKEIDNRMRRNIRSRRRKLESAFRLRYHRLGEGDNLDHWMEEFKLLHAARLRERELPSKFSDSCYDHFHRTLSRIFQDCGRLFAADLRLDGKMVAARYNFFYKNTVYDYQTGYDPEYGRLGVMQALISYMIEDCCSAKIGKFDFLAGGEDYKRRFANQRRIVHVLRIINSTPRGFIFKQLHSLNNCFRKVKQHPG